jgi:hypothetical protein
VQVIAIKSPNDLATAQQLLDDGDPVGAGMPVARIAIEVAE